MKRILLDTNVVLDVLLKRQPFDGEARRLWQASDEGHFEACIATFTIPTIYYICEKLQGRAPPNERLMSACEPSKR